MSTIGSIKNLHHNGVINRYDSNIFGGHGRSPRQISPIKHAPSIRELVERKKHRERRLRKRQKTLSSGWKADALNGICLVLSLALFLAHFDHLQSTADYKLFDSEEFFPEIVSREFLPNLVVYGHWISAASFLALLLATFVSKTRITFPCLLAFFAWPVLVFLHFEQNHSRDYLMSRLALSSFTILLYAAIIFLPKKLKHMKRPNTIYSAFSVASTPQSQLSSSHWTTTTALDDELSQSDKTTVGFDDDNASVASFHTNFSSASKWNNMNNAFLSDENSSTLTGLTTRSHNNPFSSRKSNFQNSNKRPFLRPMSTGSPFWQDFHNSRSSFTTSPNVTSKWREPRDNVARREETPMREVRQRIGGLFLNGGGSDEEVNRGGRRLNYSDCADGDMTLDESVLSGDGDTSRDVLLAKINRKKQQNKYG